MGYDAYILCTAPRSGSTLLCDLLGRSGVAGAPGSHFHRPSLADWARAHGVRLDPAEPERDALTRVVEAAIATGRGDSDLFGLRLQRQSFDFFTRQLAILHPEADGDLARITARFGRCLFIHLTRADKVAQAVSYVMAEQTGLWHRAPDGNEIERISPPADPQYDPDALRRQVDLFRSHDRAWQGWFRAEGITPLVLRYEDLAAAPQQALARCLSALQLDPRIAPLIQPGVARLADATNQIWCDRFRADVPDLE
ncbi:MAG: Stf0 sulfotransferase family protein [Marinibacterium sp.]|nr:Stf0 sulfotransferase family protein [Marinibacterium sp.]